MVDLRHVHSFSFSAMFEYMRTRKLRKMTPSITLDCLDQESEGGVFVHGILRAPSILCEVMDTNMYVRVHIFPGKGFPISTRFLK